MNTHHPPIVGDNPAPRGRAGLSIRPHPIHRAASTAAIFLALAAVFILSATTGHAGRYRTAGQTAAHRNPPPGRAALTVDDLPATLDLSSEQRQELAAALTELQRDRNNPGQRLAIRSRGRDRTDDRAVWRERRGARARLHADDRAGWEGRPGPGDRRRCPDRPRRDLRPRAAGPGAGFAPPMIGFLEKASPILSADQFVTLVDFLADRRTEMRPGAEALPAPLEGPFGLWAARRLELTESQQEQLKPLLATFGEGMRRIRADSEAGTATPEQARDRAKDLRRSLEQGAQRILTPEQWREVKEFRETSRDRASTRRLDGQARHVDHITGIYLRVLGLDETKATRVREIMAATIPERRVVAERQVQGILEPEDFAYELQAIEKNAARQVREVLTPDQAKRLDALIALLPHGPYAGGPGGGPMGGPMLDPPGGPGR